MNACEERFVPLMQLYIVLLLAIGTVLQFRWLKFRNLLKTQIMSPEHDESSLVEVRAKADSAWKTVNRALVLGLVSLAALGFAVDGWCN